MKSVITTLCIRIVLLEVPSHGGLGCFRIALSDGGEDLAVPDQGGLRARRLDRSAPRCLEQPSERLQEHREHRVAGRLGELVMETDVGIDTVRERRRPFEVVDRGLQCRDVRVAGPLRRQPRDRRLERPADFGELQERGPRTLEEQFEGFHRGPKIDLGHPRAGPLAHDDEALRPQAPHRLADHRARDGQGLCHASFARQRRSRSVASGDDLLTEVVDDLRDEVSLGFGLAADGKTGLAGRTAGAARGRFRGRGHWFVLR
jgi:hypothetical protein